MSFSAAKFWNKISRNAKAIGEKVVYAALLLYYTLQAPATPSWAKVEIVGALAYLIWPVDAIPDFIPVVGYVDDYALLLVTLVITFVHITPQIRQQAKRKTEEWFGADLCDVGGIWTGQISEKNGTSTIHLRLEQNAALVTGSGGPDEKTQQAISDAAIEGHFFAFALPRNGNTWKFDLVVNGSVMDGFAVPPDQSCKHRVARVHMERAQD